MIYTAANGNLMQINPNTSTPPPPHFRSPYLCRLQKLGFYLLGIQLNKGLLTEQILYFGILLGSRRAPTVPFMFPKAQMSVSGALIQLVLAITACNPFNYYYFQTILHELYLGRHIMLIIVYQLFLQERARTWSYRQIIFTRILTFSIFSTFHPLTIRCLFSVRVIRLYNIFLILFADSTAPPTPIIYISAVTAFLSTLMWDCTMPTVAITSIFVQFTYLLPNQTAGNFAKSFLATTSHTIQITAELPLNTTITASVSTVNEYGMSESASQNFTTPDTPTFFISPITCNGADNGNVTFLDVAPYYNITVLQFLFSTCANSRF